MFPIQRLRGSTNTDILGVFALIGAVVVPVLAMIQIANGGAASWLRFGIVEGAFVSVLAVIWIRQRRRRT
ncbi:Hypothetical protein A7982_08164 [Minicystis rosea]|nr:Hypothetical protein A7982_08164 [Minicystis rosea]